MVPGGFSGLAEHQNEQKPPFLAKIGGFSLPQGGGLKTLFFSLPLSKTDILDLPFLNRKHELDIGPFFGKNLQKGRKTLFLGVFGGFCRGSPKTPKNPLFSRFLAFLGSKNDPQKQPFSEA